jgi:hypothetical protein
LYKYSVTNSIITKIKAIEKSLIKLFPDTVLNSFGFFQMTIPIILVIIPKRINTVPKIRMPLGAGPMETMGYNPNAARVEGLTELPH